MIDTNWYSLWGKKAMQTKIENVRTVQKMGKGKWENLVNSELISDKKIDQEKEKKIIQIRENGVSPSNSKSYNQI